MKPSKSVKTWNDYFEKWHEGEIMPAKAELPGKLVKMWNNSEGQMENINYQPLAQAKKPRSPYIHLKDLHGMREAIRLTWIKGWKECDDGEHTAVTLQRNVNYLNVEYDDDNGSDGTTTLEIFATPYDEITAAVVAWYGE